MILPIYLYGNPVLRNKSKDISGDYPHLHQLIHDMFETMYAAKGVGLAAPQVGLNINLFIVDASPFAEDDNDNTISNEEKEKLLVFRKIFINARIEKEEGNEWKFNEGCLSIPGIREDVMRKPIVTISYLDENFVSHTETFDGIAARIIQHEYDHTQGILFIDKISPFRKKMIAKKLKDIESGWVVPKYKFKL
ncbi:MAG: peptide deformylase [Bacteroidetes bacterium]|jgi:peptide deformylase|nr:MAG: peptide deformylase [Bacteroidota bacterium]